ncbi:MAG: signal peptide peptidase SppA [Deltaproteobacteria bacterium]|nr:signal peptide peptidase SppA [Deltaproteobacteria bacterium]
MRKLTAIVLLTLLLIIISNTSSYAQQTYVNPTDGVLLSSPSVTEINDATAISVNPANMGFMGSWSLVYTGSWVDSQPYLAGHGHGLFFSFPFKKFALGISTELLLPPQSIQSWQGLDKRLRLSLALSFNPMRALGIGFAYRTFPGYDLGDLIHTFDFSLTIRPLNYLNFVFMFKDFNHPLVTYAPIDEDIYTLPSRTVETPGRFITGLTIRPFGNDRFAIGGEFQYIDGYTRQFDLKKWSYEKVTLQSTNITGLISWMITDGVTIKSRFTATGLGSSIENNYFLDTSLVLDSSRIPIGISASPYYKISPKEDNGFLGMNWSFKLSGEQLPAIPMLLSPYYVINIELESKMDSFAFSSLMETLERIEQDKSVNMILLKPSADSITLAQGFEINSRIKALKNKGISTTCYINDTSISGYLSCVNAENIWVNPAGGIRAAGLSSTAVYFKDLLDKIGVKADIVKIGEYKSAPESVTRTSPSKENTYQMERYLESSYERLLSGIKDGRKFNSYEETKKALESGPFMAKEAVNKGLADKVVPMDLIEDELGAYTGKRVYIDNHYGSKPLAIRTYLDSPKIAVLHVEGDIVEGESVKIPMLGIYRTGAKTMMEEIRKLKENPAIKAVVVRIKSPGGSALASDIIWRELMNLKKTKPVIASLGDIAASGGYYIASAADIIFSDPNTLTGSIGVYYGKADISGLLAKAGINVSTINKGTHADIQSWTRMYTDQEREKLKEQLDEYYRLFLNRVADGREHGFTISKVDKRAKGRIWSGADAKHQLLVDRIGGYQDAINYARGAGFVAKGTTVVHLPQENQSMMGIFAKKMGLVQGDSLLSLFTLAKESKALLKALLPFTMSAETSPQARLPFAIIEN